MKQSYCPHDVDALEWCVLPQLDLPRFWAESSTSKNVIAELRHTPKLRGAEVLGGLVLWGTQNGKRTFEALSDIPSYREVTLTTGRVPWVRSVLDNRPRKQLVSKGRQVLDSNSLSNLYPVWSFILKHASWCLSLAKKTNLSKYKFIAVSSGHAPYARAFIWEAAKAGVPTLYVPHAPVGANAQYMDLPTSAVGLRGEGERELYSRVLGIKLERMAVVGNPASDVLEEQIPKIDINKNGILALSPQPIEVLERIIGAVERSGLTELSVAPHPRSDVARLKKMVPLSWTIEEGRRTLDLLRDGPPFLLQHSSGVAWEAIALGIPTMQISLDAASPNYYFLRDESVFPSADVSDPAAIAHFVKTLDHSEFHRKELRDYAFWWCGCDGAQSREKLINLLSTAGQWPSSMVFDGWGSGPNITTEMSHLL